MAAAYLTYLRSDAHRRGNRLFYRDGRPNRLGRAVGRLWARAAAAGIGPSYLVALETVGHRTGARHAIPVVLADHEGERYVVSMLGERSPWVRNVRAAGGWAVIRHGGRREVRLTELPAAERGPVIKAFLARALDARPHIPVDPAAPREAFDAIASSYPVFRLDPISGPAVARTPSGSSRTGARRRIVEGPAEIASGVFCLGPRGRSQTNVYLARAGSGWVVVDAGWSRDAPWIEAGVREILGEGLAPAAILLTHVHPDHAGSARALCASWHCRLLLHPSEAPIARGDFAAMERWAGPLDRWVILPAMRALGPRRRRALMARGSLAGRVDVLASGGVIPGIDEWTWVSTAGHTPGHVSFVRMADRVVLTGDALVTLQVNALSGLIVGRQGLSGPPWYTTWDRRAAAASIRSIADLEPTVLGGGHGRPMAGPGVSAAVRRYAMGVDVNAR